MLVAAVIFALVSLSHAKWVIRNGNGEDMLEVVNQDNGVRLFTDSGSGADQDLSVFEPSDMPGFWRTGHCATNGYPLAMPCTLPMVMDISGLGPIDINRPLATPTGVDPTPIWDDKGSGSDQDYAFWRLQCPTGFVALSDFGTASYAYPSFLTSRARCVNIQLVHQCSIGAKIWDDSGSGSDRDGSIWRVANGQNSARFDQHFVVAAGYNPPSRTPWCFRAIVEVPDDE